MFDDCLIMAGGSGTRLWPASNSRLPKQFLPASAKASFFSLAVERALSVTGNNGRVIVIAGKAHIPHVLADVAGLSAGKKKRMLIIGEPVAKNTAPAIACAISYSLLSGGGNMLVLTSDHIIKPLEAFKADAKLAASFADRGKLVVFGVSPSRAETGYGYIETGNAAGGGARKVAAFHEKPDARTAKKYAASKRFFWNSGMFAFSAEFMAGQFRGLAPKVFLPFEKLKVPKADFFAVSDGVRVLDGWPELGGAYRKTESVSFDYAIVEKCAEAVMVRANFDWIDIGNWEEYAKVCATGGKSRVFGLSKDTCYVDSDIPVALAGVEDLIVVIRSGKNGAPATALITGKGQTQKVRDVVEEIKKTGNAELL